MTRWRPSFRAPGPARPAATVVVLFLAVGGAAVGGPPRQSAPGGLAPFPRAVPLPPPGSAAPSPAGGAGNAPPVGTVEPVDGRVFDLSTTLPSAAVNSPTGLAIDPGADVALAANGFAATVTEFRAKDGAVLAAAEVAPAGPGTSLTSLVLDLSSREAFVGVDAPGTGWLAVLVEGNLTEVANLSLPSLSGGRLVPGPMAYDAATGQLFVANATDGSVVALNATSLRAVALLRCPVSACRATGLAVVPGLRELAETTGTSALVLDSTSNDSLEAVLTGPPSSVPAFPAFDSRRGRLVTGNGSPAAATFLLFDPAERTYLGNLPGAPTSMSSLLYDAPDDLLVATDLAAPAEVGVYSPASGAMRAVYRGAGPTVPPRLLTEAVYDPATGVLLTGGPFNGTSLEFRLPSLEPLAPIGSFPFAQVAVAVDDPAGLAYVAGTWPDQVRAVSLADGGPVWTATAPPGPGGLSLAVDPGAGHLYATGASQGAVGVYNATTGAREPGLVLPDGTTPRAIAVDPEAHLLYVAGSDGRVSLFSTTTGATAGTIPVPGAVPCALALDPVRHDAYAANCGSPGIVTELNASTLQPGSTFSVGSDPSALAVGPTGAVYVANTLSDTVSVLNATGKGPTATVGLGRLAPSALAVDSADGLLFAASGSSPTLAVVNLSGRALGGGLYLGETALAVAFDAARASFVIPELSTGAILTGREVTPPPAPVLVRVLPANGSLAAAWEPPSNDGGAPITGYSVEVGPGGTGPWSASVTTSQLSATVGGLVDGVDYEVEVRAQNRAGAGPPSTPLPASPGAVPYPVQAVAVDVRGETWLNLSWAPPASDGGRPIENYSVGYVVEGGASWHERAVGPSLVATLAALLPATAYEIRVTATNLIGTGPPSATVVADTAAPPVPGRPAPSPVPGGALTELAAAAAGGVALTGLFLARRRRRRAAASRPVPPTPTASAGRGGARSPEDARSRG